MLELNELLENNKQMKIDATGLSMKEFEDKWSIQAGKYLEQLEELEQIQSNDGATIQSIYSFTKEEM